MLFSCHFQIIHTISKIQLTLYNVHTVHTVKSAVFLIWQVGFENDMKMTPISTIIYFFSRWLELTLRDIVWYVLKL